MSDAKLKVLAVVGSLNKSSVTRIVVQNIVARLKECPCEVDMLDLLDEPLALYNPDMASKAPGFPALQARVHEADVYVLGSPDYHGSISGAMKNFLDHFWQEFTGKLFATIVASHEKGLTVTDQLRTVARQCYAWTLPYGVSFSATDDVRDGEITNNDLKKRLEMFTRDLLVYGQLLAEQRRADLAGAEPGFLERLRK